MTETPAAGGALRRTPWELVLFFLSGATSLVYEVVWMRRLSLIFGHSVFSVSTVLTAFMSGLALGSYLGGRWSDRRRLSGEKPVFFLRCYGRLELFIGVWALFSLLLFNGLESGFLSLARQGVGQGTLRALTFLGSFLVLLPPTTAMGATLPVFTQMLVNQKDEAGSRLSTIYGLNTLGACVGAAVGGLLSLPNLGLLKTVIATALVNTAIAAIAYSMAKDLGPVDASWNEASESEQVKPKGWSWLPFVFGLSGFAGMVYQLGWTRALVLSIGSSTYAFSIILTTFLAALGLGSIAYKRLFQKHQPQISHFAILQLSIAASALVVSFGMGYLPNLKVKMTSAVGHSFLTVALLDTLIVFCLLLLPTIGLGLTFPLVTHLYTSKIGELGRSLGEAYSANTCGAILGSFLGGFVLLPLLGLQNTIKLAAAANAVGGVLLLLTQPRDQGFAKKTAALGGSVVLLIGLAPSWDLAMLSAGASIGFERGVLEPAPIFYRDGVTSTVTVKLNQGLYPYLQVNGKTDASFTPEDRRTQLLLGLLPGALHPDPKEVAVIGFGSGQTPVAVLSIKGVKSLLCAELEPAVLEAQKFFAPYSEGWLEDPRLKLVEDDGRSFILGSPQKFDLIISEPSNPWIAGIGNLYTSDFYEGCREQLNPGGLMCQWCHVYSMSEEDMQLVYRTFFSVFPEGAIYRTSVSDLLLVGGQSPHSMDLNRLQQLYAQDSGSAWWLYSLGLADPRMMYASFLASRQQVVAYLERSKHGFEGGPVNTDDLPLLEFQAPLSLLREQQATSAYDSFQNLVPSAVASDSEIILGAALGRITLGYPLDLKRTLEQLLKADPDGTHWFPQLFRPLFETRAAASLELIEEQTEVWWIRRFWATLKERNGQFEGLETLYSWLLDNAPEKALYPSLMDAAAQAARNKDLDTARALYARAATLTQSDDPVVKSAILGTPDQWDEKALRKALEIFPYGARTHHYLAVRLAQDGRLEEAVAEALESDRLFGYHAGVVRLLIDLYRQLGRADEVLEYTDKLRHIMEVQNSLEARRG